jgi:tRNA dimethylallyltransferase
VATHKPSEKTLIVIAGPTAVGKTAATIDIAKHYQTEIISADSRQFFREMNIGTAKPSAEELAAVKHHFINSHSITESFSVGDFEKQALDTLNEVFRHHDVALLVGGSGLYIKAVCEGFDVLPEVDPLIRQRLNWELAEFGIEYLQQKLKKVDPGYYKQVDPHNPQRLVRALEVFEGSGKPFSSFRKADLKTRSFNTVKIGLNLPREQLYQRINDRVDIMIRDGLIEEVRSLIPYRNFNALNTVGYSELFAYFDGKVDLDTAISLIKQNTRRFAKRQLTWFNKDKEIKWFNPENIILPLI